MGSVWTTLLLAVAGTALVVGTGLAPRPGRTAVILFAGAPTPPEVFARAAAAGWAPVSMPRAGVLLAAPGGPGGVPGRPAGAWLVLDAAGARGCP